MYSLAFSSLCLIKYIKMLILTNEFSWPLYEFSITAMANYHNLRDTSLLSPVFVGQKSDSGAIGLQPRRGWAGLCSSLEVLGDNLSVHTGCWQNSDSCGYRTEVCVSLLIVDDV